MARNGGGGRARPRISQPTPSASPDEAAAITAALERFLAEHAPPSAPAPVSGWQRAALLEGVDRAPRGEVRGP
jgi:hypothetical protein